MEKMNDIQGCFEMPHWFREDHINAVNDILSFMEMDFRVDSLCSQEEAALADAVRSAMTVDQLEFFNQYRYHASKMIWMKYRVLCQEARRYTQLICDFDTGLIFTPPKIPPPPKSNILKI